jgi:hypothetical protein
MARRNSGPRLNFLDKRQVFYITWTEGGRSRQRSTGTADREQAEIAFAEFLHIRTRNAGPRDPAEILITDMLSDHAEEHGATTASPWRIGCAIDALAPFWEGRTVAEITKQTCQRYVVAGTLERHHAPGAGRAAGRDQSCPSRRTVDPCRSGLAAR